MATPEFILELRKKVGHDLLWLTGITAVVLDDDERVLLVRRADTGRWSLPAGILEPGEQPALGLLREIEEETAVESEIVRLVSIEALPPSSYPNGDQVQFLDFCFRCRPIRGEARVNDDESLEVAWYSLDDLPELTDRELTYLANARKADEPPLFAR
ncbi:ADP-ribose pyrophosphatase YjhB (NUDIX family) [Kribbella orskensis]|uniref:ADP-ribose pyrophosphatase YjhB (NUDIX family) n=1 Tax=Kribbella orskensis TaxID=2512216 RepID=A0ABY2BR77_9ACTN|nr:MULTISPECIES: NUDIX domain-containing protein [Kribbella]TCN43244.1 ADP-ribose pyrophosphatase YjhB (NUDIX family) [Kribbella sp. VKM Ac-2500]TCO29400.1 ADP-ribose pyrophosphatase YjhB (NUDIX family) [Kribbella orskensis]